MRTWLAGTMLLLSVAGAQRYETIEDLTRATFGTGALRVTRVLERTAAFTRSEVRFDSDGVSVAGFMNVPAGKGPFPVVLALHGYVEPTRYRLLDYTTRYADDLARAGFLVIHPNYRGHGTSGGQAEGVWRSGYARDVLHLAALVRRDAGKTGPLVNATRNIGLWGHSMGGGIAQRVAVVDPNVKAVVLYGAMSGDERKNARQIYEVYSGRTRGQAELNASQSVVDAISPINYLARSKAAWSVHHGTADRDVPAAWSKEVCARLKAAGKSAECFEYAGAPHIFRNATDVTFRTRVIEFFRRTLR